MDIDHLRTWIGRTETLHDDITKTPVQALAATLDRNDPPPNTGDVLPKLWHWLYFLPIARASNLGPDGHPKRGGFLPPVPLPRRMWAGGRYVFQGNLHIGERITRTSTILDVTAKSGRTGEMIFVRVGHQIHGEQGGRIEEEHDIVYRDMPARENPGGENPGGEAPPPPRSAPANPTWHRQIVPDDVLLFRYSALTFNGHRIHYDRRYVTGEEGYPGLIVHGPLIATLLMELHRNHSPGQVTKFAFRAISPTFDIAPFTICGTPTDTGAKLWAMGPNGDLRMDATLETAPLEIAS